MKRTLMSLPFIVALPVLGLASCEFSAAEESSADDPAASSPAANPSAEAEASIRAAAAAFSDAFERGDTLTLGNLYTEDALLLAPSDTVRGRAAIRRWFRPRDGGRRFEHRLVADDLRVHGNVAIDRGRWIQEFALEDGGTSRASGVYLVVWRRGADDRWRMAYDMWHAPYE